MSAMQETSTALIEEAVMLRHMPHLDDVLSFQCFARKKERQKPYMGCTAYKDIECYSGRGAQTAQGVVGAYSSALWDVIWTLPGFAKSMFQMSHTGRIHQVLLPAFELVHMILLNAALNMRPAFQGEILYMFESLCVIAENNFCIIKKYMKYKCVLCLLCIISIPHTQCNNNTSIMSIVIALASTPLMHCSERNNILILSNNHIQSNKKLLNTGSVPHCDPYSWWRGGMFLKAGRLGAFCYKTSTRDGPAGMEHSTLTKPPTIPPLLPPSYHPSSRAARP